MLIFIIVLFLISIILYVLSFFLAQNEGLYYKNNCRTISALILAIGVLCV